LELNEESPQVPQVPQYPKPLDENKNLNI
jgi:hypothetical protein